MLSKQGFNLWAEGYDHTVQLSEESNQYPFAGYKKVLSTIYNEIMQQSNSAVLDIGFGTAVLTKQLYDHGHEINGFDFSSKMVDIAREKMPNATLIEWDFADGLPNEFKNKKYDAIVSTYALHHFTDDEKVAYIKELMPLLTQTGKIYIGDIAFETKAQLINCRQESIDYWDDDEIYFVNEEFPALLTGIGEVEFYPLSHCGGVFIIKQI